MDISTLTGAVDLATIVAGLTAIAAVMIAITAAKWGLKKIVSFFG